MSGPARGCVGSDGLRAAMGLGSGPALLGVAVPEVASGGDGVTTAGSGARREQKISRKVFLSAAGAGGVTGLREWRRETRIARAVISLVVDSSRVESTAMVVDVAGEVVS